MVVQVGGVGVGPALRVELSHCLGAGEGSVSEEDAKQELFRLAHLSTDKLSVVHTVKRCRFVSILFIGWSSGYSQLRWRFVSLDSVFGSYSTFVFIPCVCIGGVGV